MVLNFAHRGSLTEAPENTVAAIQKALDHHAKAIEIDVQLSKDNQLIVMHDHDFSRIQPEVTGIIHDYSLQALKQIDIGSTFSKAFAGEKIATLDEVLEIVPQDVLLNIEIKNIPMLYKHIESYVLECLKRHQRTEQILISSFDHEVLANIQALQAEMPLGLLLNGRLLKPWEYIQQCGLDLWSVHPNMVYTDQTFVEQVHQLDLKVYPYTVNHIHHYEALRKAGVDGVFSNEPAIFKTEATTSFG